MHIQTKVDELDKLMQDEKRLHLETQRQAKVYYYYNHFHFLINNIFIMCFIYNTCKMVVYY